MKEATGTARITFTMGRNSQSAQERAEVMTANRVPAAAPRAKPPKMRPRLTAAVRQKEGRAARAASRSHTSRGEGRSRAPCPEVYTVSTQMAASCQAPSQKARGTTTRSIFCVV